MSAPANVRNARDVAAHVQRTERWRVHNAVFTPRGEEKRIEAMLMMTSRQRKDERDRYFMRRGVVA